LFSLHQMCTSSPTMFRPWPLSSCLRVNNKSRPPSINTAYLLTPLVVGINHPPLSFMLFLINTSYLHASGLCYLITCN
jgi:hypothetical protein